MENYVIFTNACKTAFLSQNLASLAVILAKWFNFLRSVVYIKVCCYLRKMRFRVQWNYVNVYLFVNTERPSKTIDPLQ